MNTDKTSQNAFENIEVNVKLKLATLWTSLMFIYIYVDYFHLYMPNSMAEIQRGIVFKFDITQGFLSAALVSMSIPAMMIFISVVLQAKANRLVNIIIGLVYIPYTLFNLAGESWVHIFYGAAVEVVLLCLIIRYAWRWPCIEV